MFQVLTIGLLLLYFWYWTRFTKTISISKPDSPIPNPPRYEHRWSAHQNQVSYILNQAVAWQISIPDEIVFDQNRFITRNVCTDIPDGKYIAATGKDLYDYVQHNELQSKPARPFEVFASSTVQRDNVFYFTCRSNQIEKLDTCDSGMVFREGMCTPVNLCIGREVGYKFPNLHNLLLYYECPGNDQPATIKSCPKDMWFIQDACRPYTDFDTYCQLHKRPLKLDPYTLLVCENNKPKIETCPAGYQYFDSDVCESTECIGLPDGTRLPLRTVKTGPFKFSPGYTECQHERVVNKTTCSSYWDSYESNGDNLTHLPMVFDGKECSTPSFCSNVMADNPEIIVPVHEFSKRVRNWNRSLEVDNVTGYVCENGNKRKRVSLEPGYHIKHFKREKISKPGSRSFISNRFDVFFDSDTDSVIPCFKGEVFDGTACRPKIPNAFEYNNSLGLFRYDMTKNWISSWDYTSRSEKITDCNEPESVKLETYNICSHPDCVLYPFLSQIPFSIALKEPGALCTAHQKKLVKKQTLQIYNYWSQRHVEENFMDNYSCIPGKRIQSGHFVFDSIIYATCDDNQPFVFCPVTETQGIRLIDGKRWACIPKEPGKAILKAHVIASFNENELKRITRLNKTDIPLIQINNNPKEYLMASGYIVPENIKVTVWSNHAVKLEYRFQVTYPPDVVFIDGSPVLSNIEPGGAFITKRKSFTNKALAFPTYDVAEALDEFSIDGRR